MDASAFRVPESLQWATYTDGLQAAKIWVEYKQPGTTYLFDRGFWSFTDFDGYCRDGIYFVTRCKDTAHITRLTSYPVPADSDVIADQEVVFGRGIKRKEHSVRLVTVRGEDGTRVQFVTNRFDLPVRMTRLRRA